MKKLLLGFVLILAIFTLTACDSDDEDDTRAKMDTAIESLA